MACEHEVSDPSSARSVARKALELGDGRVDILINNAGIFPFGPTDEMTEEVFEKVYSLNVKAPYFLVAQLSPGPTRTEGTDAMGEGLEQLAAQAPPHRPATADEIAEAILFLATDRFSFVHGAKLAVDGGRTAL
ncbi:MAG TPA: SDR family oxidoreductase [Blastocatellia bacterium]